jgi:cytidylate kinase
MSSLSPTGLFDTCRGYIEAYAMGPQRKRAEKPRPTITLSRECGAGAVTVATIAASILDKEAPGKTPWAVFDKNLVEKVLEDHDLPRQIAKFFPEDVPAEITGAVEEMLGLHPDSWTLVQHMTDTILRLGRAGNTILVGRGANLITSQMPHAFHVRLVAPFDFRVAHYAEEYGVTKKAAAAIIPKTDRARQRYIRRHFSVAIDDPLRYHLCINTALTGFDGAARIIAEAIQRR